MCALYMKSGIDLNSVLHLIPMIHSENLVLIAKSSWWLHDCGFKQSHLNMDK